MEAKNTIKLHDKDREIAYLKESIEIQNRIIELLEGNAQFDKDRIQNLEAELSANGKFSNKQLNQIIKHLKVHYS